MTRLVICALFLINLLACQPSKSESEKKDATNQDVNSDLTIAFGSCNNQRVKSPIWKAISATNPDLFIWGGDIVYSDTKDMDKMRAAYDVVRADSGYVALSEKTEITGTWDDHDYGLNDGGTEWEFKDSVQQILLDFLEVEKKDPRRTRKGIYHSILLERKNKTVKIIVLDTRYFRTALTKDPTGEKRYVPNPYGQGTMLGETQWQWLKEELSDPEIDFSLIMSSIQFLSGEHGFESWSNMPHEVDRMIDLIETVQPRGVLFLSGDRHIAEFSSRQLGELSYPLIDFTASGMTHSYSSFSGEPNKYRVSEVISDKNFGLLKFDLDRNEITMEIRSENNEILGSHSQKY